MKKHALHSVLPLLIFALFATVILSTLMSGAKVYNRLSARGGDTFISRTVAQYITVKIQQTENQGDIFLDSFGDGTALVLPSEYSEQEYVTRLYCYDGYLCELFSSSDALLSAQDGEKILPLDLLDAKLEGELLTINLFDGSDAETLHIYLNGKGTL